MAESSNHRKGLSRTYSGDGCSRGGGGDAHDRGLNSAVSHEKSAAPIDLLVVDRRRQRQRGTPAGAQSTAPIIPRRFSWLTIFLSAGLLFCLMDVVYIWVYVGYRHDNVLDGAIDHSVTHDAKSSPQKAIPRVNGDQPPAQAMVAAKDRSVESLPSDWVGSGQAPILELLEEALGGKKEDSEGVGEQSSTGGGIDPDTAARLPTAEAVAALYGRDPVVLGLESCERFQGMGDPADHFVSTAGTFNTGTNLMAELLIANCVLPARQQKYGTRGVRWQVVWGKHTPVDDEQFRQSHRTYDDGNVQADAMFPAVMIRDPFKWMQSVRYIAKVQRGVAESGVESWGTSLIDCLVVLLLLDHRVVQMCRHPYAADWVHEEDHCPNLLPNEYDYQLLAIDEKEAAMNGVTMNVTVKYAEFSRQHASLVEFWNDWYKAYAEASFPRLIVRFEDVVFHPKQITKTVCECAGGQLDPDRPFKFIVDSAKKGAAHGTEKTSYVDALIKYGTEEGRYEGFDGDDLEYAREHLDPDLMRLFGYRYPPPSSEK
jgi:hypothetical protein